MKTINKVKEKLSRKPLLVFDGKRGWVLNSTLHTQLNSLCGVTVTQGAHYPQFLFESGMSDSSY